MKLPSLLLVLALAFLLQGSASAQIGGCTPDETGAIAVQLDTSLGPIVIDLFPNTAPGTVQNFLDYMVAGDYDGVIFHRSAKDLGGNDFVIQGGGYREEPSGYASIPRSPSIVNEACLSNLRGTVAMARLGGQPNSATSEFFINLSDSNVFLDGIDSGFTAFGRVAARSMEVADAIAALPVYDTLNYLELPINQIFRELPLQNLPTDPPGGYGCSRDGAFFGLANPALTLFEADPLRSGGIFVPILLDTQCTGAGATGPPSVPCTPGTGRIVGDFEEVTGLFPMTCDAIAESLDSWTARRAGTEPQLMAEDVEMINVPEPSRSALLAAGGALVVTLARRMRGITG